MATAHGAIRHKYPTLDRSSIYAGKSFRESIPPCLTPLEILNKKMISCWPFV